MRFLLFNSAFIIWFFSLLTHLSSVLTPPRTFIIGGQEVQLHWFWDTVTRIIDKTLTVSDAQVDRMLELVIMYALILLPVMFISAYLPRIFKNRKTKDYGSAAWATKSELRRNGLIGRYGIIFGQCHEARYKEVVDKKSPTFALTRKARDKARRAEVDNPDERAMFKYELKKPADIISYHSNKHCIVVGTTRSGKGISCVIPTCLSWNESLVVLDPKGEAWTITAPVRAQFSKTFKFEPENPAESVHYNPILAVRRGLECIPDIQSLGQILLPAGSGGSSGEFWINEARKLFTALVGYIAYCRPAGEKNFGTLVTLFSDERVPIQGERSTKAYLKAYADEINTFIANQGISEENRKELERLRDSKDEADRREYQTALESNMLTDEDIQTLRLIHNDLMSCYNEEDKVLQDVLSTMTSTLTFFSDPQVQEVTRYSDFSFEDAMYGDTPISIYMVASSAALVRLAPLFKIMYEQSIAILTRKLRKYNFRLLLLFDEFRQMGRMEIVEKSLSLSAGYGVICMIIVQSYSQLTQIYQHKAVLLDNFAYQVVLNANDPENLRDIEAQLGNYTVQRRTTSYSGQTNQPLSTGENESVSEMSRALMTADEIRRLPFEDALLIPLGAHPYRMKKIMWFTDPRFTQLTQKYSHLPTLEEETGMDRAKADEEVGRHTAWHNIYNKAKVQSWSSMFRKRYQVQDDIQEPVEDERMVEDGEEGAGVWETVPADEDVGIALDVNAVPVLFEMGGQTHAGRTGRRRDDPSGDDFEVQVDDAEEGGEE